MSLVTYDTADTQSVEATGHPTDCTEPIPGSVTGSAPHSVTVSNASGEEAAIATYANATLHFDTHSHEYSDKDDDGTKECHNDSSHDIDEASGYLNKANWSSSISISPAGESSSPVLVLADGVGTDPITASNVNAIGTGISNSLTETEP